MDQPKILVAIRKRPLSKKEQSKGQTDIITVKNTETVIVSEYKQKVDLTKYLEETVFNFDYAFNQQITNQQIYEQAVRPLVDSAFQGAKVTCFAYGQTGSGKTFTMNGNYKMGVYGLYTLGANDIFAYLSDSRFRHLSAKVSYFQIYCNKLFDLLNKRSQLTLREDNKSNINIIGLQQTPVQSMQRFQELLNYGSTQRITSQNSANAQSSRSHAILQITLKDGKKVFGRISFIDLAGNQRGADHTDMKKQTRIDGAQINKSLLSLKQCIRALDQGKGHTPFRGSKLTMVLKDSFVGFCRTIMIGNVSPSSASSQNTLNTLRYADRVKQLRKPSETLSKQQRQARQMMLPRQNKNAIKIDINNDDDADDIQLKRKEAQKNYGIKQQSPKPSKQMQRQMSSDPYRRNMESDRNRQQSFGGPSVSLSRPLVGGLKQSHGPILQVPQMTSPNLPGKQQPKSPAISTNLGKINLPNQQPQQQKGPINSQRNIIQNSSYQQPQLYQNQGYEQSSGLKRINSINPNDPKGIYDNRMEQQPNNNMMTHSQFVPKNTNNYMQNSNSNQLLSNNGQFYSNNNPKSFRQDLNQNNSQQYNPYQNNPNSKFPNQISNQYQNNMQQPNIRANGPQNMQPNTQMNNNRMVPQQQYNEADKMNQYRSNYQQPDQRVQQPMMQNQQINRLNQYRPNSNMNQKVQIPQDWEGMIQFVSTANDPDLKVKVHQKIHQQLFQEQNQLIASHSDTLRGSLDCLKSQMNLIADLQNNREAISTRQYLSLMQESIDQKISLLEMLRQKMIQFTYKLDRVEQIDDQNQNLGPREDQQLLDDLH